MKSIPALGIRATAPLLALALATAIAAPAGATEVEPSIKAKKGLLRIVSGATGRPLGKIKGLQRGDEFASDLGGDALPDLPFGVSAYLMGAPGADGSTGRVWAIDVTGRPTYWHLSGADLAGSAVARFGAQIQNLGHINGDTPVHWAIGAPGIGAGGPSSAVVIVHAPDGRLAERFRLEASPEARLGFGLVAAEDDRRDSIIDHFVVSAPGEANGAKRAAGALHRISALDGSISWTLLGKRRGEHLGFALAITPDEDGDDVWEIVAGAPGNRKQAGKVLVVSGATGRTLRQIDAPEGAGLFGFAFDRADVDGDGIDDLVVGAPRTDGAAGAEVGAVYAYSGVDHSLIWSREGETPGQWLGVSINDLPRPNTDGSTLLVVGSLFVDESKPKKSRRGGIDVFVVPGATELSRARGKRGNDRLGWNFVLSHGDEDEDGVTDILVGLPRGGEPFLPD